MENSLVTSAISIAAIGIREIGGAGGRFKRASSLLAQNTRKQCSTTLNAGRSCRRAEHRARKSPGNAITVINMKRDLAA